MSAQEHFQTGRLTEAVQAALTTVKKQPNDLNARFFLAELFCFQGDWERADRQLDTVVKQPANATMRAQLFRHLIRAEIAREQVLSEGRPPELVVPLPLAAQLQLELCAAIRLKQSDDYRNLCDRALAAQTLVRGNCNGTDFEGLQDLDERFSSTLEVMTASGKYYWVPWSSVRSLAFTPAERPMDLIWRKAQVDVDGGPRGEVYVPVRYPFPNSETWDDAQRLGRATDWAGDETTVTTGVGQRMLLVGEEAVAIMELKLLTNSELPAAAEPSGVQKISIRGEASSRGGAGSHSESDL